MSALCALATLLSTAPAAAADYDGVVTQYELSGCDAVESGGKPLYRCPGYDGIPVFVARVGDKGFVSPGETGADEMAAGQTLPEPRSTPEPKIEWRVTNPAGKWQAIATIQKWRTRDKNDLPGEILVVTKLEPGATCHIAYFDAVVTPDVYFKARNHADLFAPKFRCGRDTPVWIPDRKDNL